MPLAQDLRHFHKGVTKVKVWAGRESREMMRQFLPVVVDAQAPPEFIRVIRALLDFSYLAHYEQLTDDNLLEMEQALKAFHQAKKILTHGETAVVPGLGAFDRLPKLHMLGHYTQSIRELGTPDGYSTETPEHLHIIYVKNGWRMSNRRDPIPQIVNYVKRLESIYIQRTFIDEFYGESPGVDTEEEDMYGDDEDDEAENCNSWEDAGMEENDDADEEEAVCEEEQVESETYYDHRYPRPQIRLARKPTVPQVPGHVLVSSYCASDFTRALQRFLEYKARQLGEDLFLLPSDCFDVWHKATLVHSSPPFTNLLPRHDAIRVRPVTRNRSGCIVGPGLSDTGLYATSRDNNGLTQLRAGRVHAIFTLPPRLRHLYSGHLVYLDVFTPFKPDATDSHLMFTTTQAYFDGLPAGLVLPLSCLSMGCHLAPDFSFPPTPAPSLGRSKMPTTTFNHFVFNEFYNHFTYLWMAAWRQPYIC